MSILAKDEIIEQIKIVELAKEFNIYLESISGNYDFKCKCPSLEHKGGSERTGSCFINSQKNTFYCYGCNKGYNSIDFYMLCADVNFAKALAELKTRVKLGLKSNHADPVKTNNFSILLKTSHLFRKLLLKHPEDQVWIEKLIEAYDQKVLELESDDESAAKQLLNQVKEKINKRYQK